MFSIIVQGLIYVFMAPLLQGLEAWFRGLRYRRFRTSLVFQPLINYFYLIKRPGVRPSGTVWIMDSALYIIFFSFAIAGFLFPIFHLEKLPGQMGGLLLVAVLFLGWFVDLLESESQSNTEVPFVLGHRFTIDWASILAIFILVLLMLQWDSTDFYIIFSDLRSSGAEAIFTNPSFFVLLLLMASVQRPMFRSNADDRETHLELVMIEKAIYLEYAGRDLALLQWGHSLREIFKLILLSNLLIPVSLSTSPNVIQYILWGLLLPAKILFFKWLFSIAGRIAEFIYVQ